MAIRISFLFSFLLLVHGVSAQHSNYLEYRSHINKAELHLIDSDIKKALLEYDSSFNLSFGFARDYYNAAKCAFSIKNYPLCLHYLLQLSSVGTDINEIKQDLDLKVLYTFRSWPNFENEYMRSYKKWQLNEKKDFRTKIDSLVRRDQSVRSEGYNNKVQREIDITDSVNVDALCKLIQCYGFPTERRVGCVGLRQKEIFYVLMHHYFQKRAKSDTIPDLSGQFKNYVLAGDLSPYTFSDWFDLQGHITYFSTVIYRALPDSNWYSISLHSIDSLEIEQINKNRSEIGLERIDEYLRKVLFSFKNSFFDFEFPWSKETLRFGSIGSAFYFLKNSTLEKIHFK
jgi:hypothetical protein